MFSLSFMQVTIDAENNVWVTDVAMHQVFQFPPYGGKDKMPNIVLGKPVRITDYTLFHFVRTRSFTFISPKRTKTQILNL
jgi:hypothetical protein